MSLETNLIFVLSLPCNIFPKISPIRFSSRFTGLDNSKFAPLNSSAIFRLEYLIIGISYLVSS